MKDPSSTSVSNGDKSRKDTAGSRIFSASQDALFRSPDPRALTLLAPLGLDHFPTLAEAKALEARYPDQVGARTGDLADTYLINIRGLTLFLYPEAAPEAPLTEAESASIQRALRTQTQMDPYYDKAPLVEADHEAMHRLTVQAARELDPVVVRVRALGTLVRSQLAGFIATPAERDAALQLCSYLVDAFCEGLCVGRDADDPEKLDNPHCSSLHWRLRVEATEAQAEGLANAA